MENYFVIETKATENIYGYGGAIMQFDEHTKELIIGLRAKYNAITQIDNSIYSVSIYDVPFSIDLMNDEFDGLDEAGKIEQLSDEDYNAFTNTDDNEYRVENPYLKLKNNGFQIVWTSKWTNDEVWVEISWEVVNL